MKKEMRKGGIFNRMIYAERVVMDSISSPVDTTNNGDEQFLTLVRHHCPQVAHRLLHEQHITSVEWLLAKFTGYVNAAGKELGDDFPSICA